MKTHANLTEFTAQAMDDGFDEVIQKDSMRFRRNIERIGEVMAYEISKTLDYAFQEITTPLGVAEISLPVNQPLLCTIMRAGLPMKSNKSYRTGFQRYPTLA